MNNPSFEAEWKRDGTPMDWRFYTNAGGRVTHVTPPHDGPGRDRPRERRSHFELLARRLLTPFVARPGYRYQASVWAKSGRAPDSVEMEIQFFNGANTRIANATTTGDAWGINSAAWQRMSVVATAPAGAAYGKLVLGVRGGAGSLPVAFDDVALTADLAIGDLRFYPPQGTHTAGTIVNVIAPAEGIEIHYTTDGSEPTQASPVYSYEIRLTAPCTIKARGYRAGSLPTPVATVSYGVTPKPVSISPGSGTYNDPVGVYLSCATTGTEIRYTLDGSEPTSASALFSGLFTVNSNATVKARAFKVGFTPTAASSATYAINDSAVVITPPGGVFTTSPLKVRMQSDIPGARIYFSTAGALPTKYTSRYSGTPVSVYHSMTMRARALKPDGSWGPLTIVKFVVNTALPSFAPYARAYTSAQSVRITYPVPNTKIYYTTDGSTPNISSSLYAGPVRIGRTTTLKARALVAGTTWSPVKSGVFTIRYGAPYFSPAAGTYASPQRVTVKHDAPGARIFYTLDGSTPTTASPPYGGPIEVAAATTVKARALLSGNVWSPVRTGTFTVSVLAPAFTPGAGTYFGSRAVTIAYPSAGAKIHYTTDGSEPDANSPVYRAPVTIDTTITLKARAQVGTTWSGTKTAVYNVRYGAPSITPVGGTYATAQTVAIAYPTAGALIHYTTDGSLPNASSALYAGPFTISSTCLLRARAVVGGVWTPTSLATFTILTSTLPAPTFDPPPSSTYFMSIKHVTIAYAASPSAPIYYTTDGTLPTASSTHYTGPVTIDTTTTLTARALVGSTWSAARTGVYNIRYPAPAMSPSSGTYTGPKTVKITHIIPEAQIYYTTNGADPATAGEGILYTGSLALKTSCTVKARALINGHAWSALKSQVYTIR